MSLIKDDPRAGFYANNIQIFIFVVVFAIIFYSSRFLLRYFSKGYQNLEKKIQNLVAARIISTLHAFTVSNLAILILFFDSKLHQNQLLYSTYEISLNLNIVMGYMLFDFILMALYKEMLDVQFILHHTVSVSAFYACSQAGVFPYIALFRLTSEASTLFINIRWFLLTFDMKYSKYYSYNAIFIFIFFFTFRIIPIVPIWHSFYLVTFDPNWSNVALFYKLLCVITSSPLDILNLFWFYRIIAIAIKHFSSTPQVKEK